ncbi:DEAD/DEAH box helicase family protein [Fodinicurvata sp. EGI_FJ10296]|uniref:DEAD/DEAH box helicase n=1 Tax=Fodinicurvata sp. EGI_FJ10296 TaxID=3231908 RepID=UPI003456A76B
MDALTPSSLILTPAQKLGVQRMCDAIDRKVAGVVVKPTGSGKTVMMAAVRWHFPHLRAIIVSPNDDISEQNQEKFAWVGDSLGIADTTSTRYCAWSKDLTGHTVFGNSLSLIKALERPTRRDEMREALGAFDIAFVDECHHAPAPKHRLLLQNLPKLRIGLSATPLREDGKPVAEMFGKTISVMTRDEATDDGLIVPVHLEQLELGQEEALAIGKSHGLRDPNVIERVGRHWMGCREKGTAIVYAIDRRHARDIAGCFVDLGIKATMIDGTATREERRSIKQGLADGTLDMVVTCNVLGEGTDIPNLQDMLNFRVTMTPAEYLQKVGRVARTDRNNASKTRGRVFECGGASYRYQTSPLCQVAEHGAIDIIENAERFNMRKNVFDRERRAAEARKRQRRKDEANLEDVRINITRDQPELVPLLRLSTSTMVASRRDGPIDTLVVFHRMGGGGFAIVDLKVRRQVFETPDGKKREKTSIVGKSVIIEQDPDDAMETLSGMLPEKSTKVTEQILREPDPAIVRQVKVFNDKRLRRSFGQIYLNNNYDAMTLKTAVTVMEFIEAMIDESVEGEAGTIVLIPRV